MFHIQASSLIFLPSSLSLSVWFSSFSLIFPSSIPFPSSIVRLMKIRELIENSRYLHIAYLHHCCISSKTTTLFVEVVFRCDYASLWEVMSVTAFSNFLVVPWEPKPGAQMRRFNEKMTHPKFQVHRTSLDKRGG